MHRSTILLAKHLDELTRAAESAGLSPMPAVELWAIVLRASGIALSDKQFDAVEQLINRSIRALTPDVTGKVRNGLRMLRERAAGVSRTEPLAETSDSVDADLLRALLLALTEDHSTGAISSNIQSELASAMSAWQEAEERASRLEVEVATLRAELLEKSEAVAPVATAPLHANGDALSHEQVGLPNGHTAPDLPEWKQQVEQYRKIQADHPDWTNEDIAEELQIVSASRNGKIQAVVNLGTIARHFNPRDLREFGGTKSRALTLAQIASRTQKGKRIALNKLGLR